jgi:hypothetical protein
MLSDEAIIEFCFFPVVNEGCRVCDEAIVDKVADLDVATVLSMGFPAYRGAYNNNNHNNNNSNKYYIQHHVY